MKSLLKEEGINSYLAIVYAGENERNPPEFDFPYPRFNHVILCVPGAKDTTWLECTSKSLPAGYLSSFTDNRNVLLLTPDGGYLVKTPAYKEKENVLIRTITVHIDSTDAITATANYMCAGLFHDREKAAKDNSNEDTRNALNHKFSLPSCRVESYKFAEGLEGKIPYIKEEINLLGSAKVNRTMKRVFVDLAIVKGNKEVPETDEKRTTPFSLGVSFQSRDTITYKIDGSYKPEMLPEDVNITNKFGEYHHKVTFEAPNVLKVINYYCQEEGVYDADLFAAYVELCKAVNLHSESEKVALLKN
jgi:hypothetical protein